MIDTIYKDKITLLSKKGMKELKKAISQLEHNHQRALNDLRELDKTLGHDERLARLDKLSELENIESELEDKKSLLQRSKLIPAKRSHIQVVIGSVVDLIDKHGHFLRFKIVNSVEANPSDGRISTLSPLGKSLLGRNVQDVVEVGRGSKYNHFRLVRIT
jgi:transcription elongation factor GreA